MTERKGIAAVLAIFTIAFAFRLGLVMTFDVSESGFGFADESYLEYARNVAAGRGFYMDGVYGDAGPDRMLAFRPPLFPLVWGGLYNPTGGRYPPMWTLMALVSSLTCVLAYRVGLRLLGRAVPAALGALAACVYPALVFHGVNLMSEPFFMFFSVLTVLFLLRAWDEGRLSDAALAGVSLGLGALSRPILIGYAPAMALFLLAGAKFGAKRKANALALTVVLTLAACATLAPWVVRNTKALGQPVLTTTDFGHGFYVANHARAVGDPRGFYMPDDWRFALREGETSLGEVAMKRRLTGIAFDYLKSHPCDWARLVGGRFLKMLRPWPDPRFVGMKAAVISGISFLGVLPFILWGLIAAHRVRKLLPGLLLIDGLVLYTLGVHAFCLAMIRYRVPLMPFLLLIGGYGACDLAARRVGRGRKRHEHRGGFDAIAEEYDQTIPAHVRNHYLRKRVRLIRKALGNPKGVRLLDVGCGTGVLLEALRAEGIDGVGIDPSAGMLRIAREQRGVAVEQASATQLPFDDASFDAAVCVAVLHHVGREEDVARTLHEMVRVVRPGGRIIVADHNPANPYWPVIMGKVPQDSGDERLVPADEITAALTQAGAADVRVRKSGLMPEFAPSWAMPLVRCIEWCAEHTPGVRAFCAHNVIIATRGDSAGVERP